jgi:hypothetical protein
VIINASSELLARGITMTRLAGLVVILFLAFDIAAADQIVVSAAEVKFPLKFQ